MILYRFKIDRAELTCENLIWRARVIKTPTWLGRLFRRQPLEARVRRSCDADSDDWFYDGYLIPVTGGLERALRKTFPRRGIQLWRPVKKVEQITPQV